MTGLEAIKVIKKKNPSIKIIMLTSFEETALAKTALRNGADGYLLKDATETEFLDAANAVVNGTAVYPEKRTGFTAQRCHGTKERQLLYSQTYPP
jgi:DNA-binding NarL/FixJ family response regulator